MDATSVRGGFRPSISGIDDGSLGHSAGDWHQPESLRLACACEMLALLCSYDPHESR